MVNGKRPSALVSSLVEMFPFHPQTIKLRLRLLQRRREAAAVETKYMQEKETFIKFVCESFHKSITTRFVIGVRRTIASRTGRWRPR